MHLTNPIHFAQQVKYNSAVNQKALAHPQKKHIYTYTSHGKGKPMEGSRRFRFDATAQASFNTGSSYLAQTDVRAKNANGDWVGVVARPPLMRHLLLK